MTEPFNLIPAAFTPMDDAGKLNLGAISDYADYLVRNNITTVFVAGSTGECMSLSTGERKRVAEAWVEHAQSKLNIIVHVGHASLPEAESLAGHAEQLGVAGIAALSPHYIQPANEDDLIECMNRISTSAAQTPFYYYHIPSLTHMPLDILSFLEKCIERIPMMKGIKYTHEDLIEYAACLDQFGDKLDILFGRDEMLLHGLMLGTKGAVGSMYSLRPKLFQKLITAYESGDMGQAKSLSIESQEFIQTMIDFGVYPGGKSYLKSMGVDCGSVRLPLKPLSAEQESDLLKAVSGHS
jgi:N-acetylneuraminate lyase